MLNFFPSVSITQSVGTFNSSSYLDLLDATSELGVFVILITQIV
jgi:hypothetical protein